MLGGVAVRLTSTETADESQDETARYRARATRKLHAAQDQTMTARKVVAKSVGMRARTPTPNQKRAKRMPPPTEMVTVETMKTPKMRRGSAEKRARAAAADCIL